MPIFNYKCSECNHIMEVFQHASGSADDVICEECESKECERLPSNWNNRVWLESKDMLREKILPDARRIREDMSKGKDSTFLDIYGDN